MTHEFKRHPITELERRWLAEADKSDAFDPRVAKVKLWDSLPRDFEPAAIDARVYSGNRPTLIGRWHLNPEHPLLRTVDKTIHGIRALIKEKPGIETIAAGVLASRVGLATTEVSRALFELGHFRSHGSFFSSARASSPGSAYDAIELSGPNAYDEYLRYDGIDNLLERDYVASDPQRRVAQAVLLSDLLPQYRRAEVTSQVVKKDHAFVLMAMDPSKAELEDVYDAIKQCCRRFGVVAHRADDIQHQDSITEVILREIRDCEYLIADLSYERPNVYYEVGYAHALGKKPILYRRFGTALHFDLTVHNVPEYKSASALRRMLHQRLEAITGRSLAEE